jgi:hypothetical protein
MHEALMLFEDILKFKYFEKSKITVLLTKRDVFDKRVSSGRSLINKYFPDYPGD